MKMRPEGPEGCYKLQPTPPCWEDEAYHFDWRRGRGLYDSAWARNVTPNWIEFVMRLKNKELCHSFVPTWSFVMSEFLRIRVAGLGRTYRVTVWNVKKTRFQNCVRVAQMTHFIINIQDKDRRLSCRGCGFVVVLLPFGIPGNLNVTNNPTR